MLFVEGFSPNRIEKSVKVQKAHARKLKRRTPHMPINDTQEDILIQAGNIDREKERRNLSDTVDKLLEQGEIKLPQLDQKI